MCDVGRCPWKRAARDRTACTTVSLWGSHDVRLVRSSEGTSIPVSSRTVDLKKVDVSLGHKAPC